MELCGGAESSPLTLNHIEVLIIGGKVRMKKYLNKEGVFGYPDAIKEQPFCCWRWDQGQMTALVFLNSKKALAQSQT